MQNPHFGSKIKIPKNLSKTIVQIIDNCSVQKAARKNTKDWRNKTILKIGHHAKAIAHAKSFTVVLWKTQLFCAKKRSKKHQILKKWDHFESRSPCKGYSPCKILTLGQKLKFQETCQNPFYKSFTIVLCKKPLEKTPNIGEIRPFWKSAIMQRL